MKKFNELTYLGKVRRFRRLAKTALEAYGMDKDEFRLVRLAGNALFRVFQSKSTSEKKSNNRYEENQYLLRIHDRSEQDTEAITLEMLWLDAICRETDLIVPKPINTRDGSLLTQAEIHGVPDKRDCTLLGWVKGRFVTQGIKTCHFEAQGRIMAQLHNHAERWCPPKGLSKRSFDWKGLFSDDVGAGLANSEAWSLLPHRYIKPYKAVAQKVKRLMDNWGKTSDVYGLIHGDCGVDANVLFWRGEARPIDFDGSGFGYYAYDLSLALEHCWDDVLYPQYRTALIDGYNEYRSLSDVQLKHMNLFLAAFYVYMGLWTTAINQVNPKSADRSYRIKRWQDRGLKFIRQYL